MICNICGKRPAVIFSSKEENGKRKMEGLCIECAKKQGINTEEILKAQSDTTGKMQIDNMNKQLEGLFKNLTENLGSIEGIELGAIPVDDMMENDEDDDEEFDDNPSKIFAKAIPLGSIFGNLPNFQNQNSEQQAENGNEVKKKVKPEKKKSKIWWIRSLKINFKIKIDKESSINPIILDKVSFSYDNKHKIINNLSFTLTRGEKFLIVGNNGVGKSTLLKLIVSKLKPNKGIIDINYKTKIAYYAQEHELLDNNKTIMDNFLDTNYSDKEIRNCLGRFMFYGDDVFKEIKTLSPGERARVMLAKISLSGANVLILDEPTNHLDPETQSKISDIFREYEGTMLVVSHNEDFVRNLQIERMLILPEGKITFYSEDKFDKYKKVNI